MRRTLSSFWPQPLAVAGLVAAALALTPAPIAAQEIVQTDKHAVELTRISRGFDHPWGMAFLPDGTLLVTERSGQMRIVNVTSGERSAPIENVPRVVASGQGGLLDVTLDPDFAENRLVYISYSEPGDGGAGTTVARAALSADGTRLDTVAVIFRMVPKSSGGRHFGSRLVFAPDGTLFVTLGDRGERDRVQDFTIHRGQVVRINSDGSVPADNPFVNTPGYRPETWSLGHRNAQGADIHPKTGALWTVEHGARGGDEVNIPEAGKNYGWPIISYGRHYSGFKIGEGQAKEGLEQPIHYWDPSIAPSGATFYTGTAFSEWTGDFFVTALRSRMLVRLEVTETGVVAEEAILEGKVGRVRDVETGPDGALYILTDADPGALFRLSPAR